MQYDIVQSENAQKMIIKGKPEVIIMVILGIWSSACMAPLFSFPFIAYDSLNSIGTKTLSCEHNAPKKVICKQTADRFLGYAKPEETTWQNVTKADFHLVTRKKGRDQQWITLKTNETEITIFSDRLSSSLNMEAEELALWVEKFNKFVDSGSGKIELIYPASQQWQVLIFPCLLLLFPVIGILLAYLLLQWHCLTFDRNAQSLIWEVQTIFGKQNYQFLLTDIQEIKMTKVRGNKGGTFYYIKIYIYGRKSAIALVSNSITTAQNMAQNLGSFLQINVQDFSNQTPQR
ncbi:MULTISPECIES: hypothetical protein [Pseudanabaena]|uniref:Uncharacterized protein n=2 Tax=Pseudanabaena TaxID=1152 RepID=L8MZ95_9CYAN|nr:MULTISPECIES: hypothetical protein [Pseudanabaena]ELS32811.1 hypothetical protein Pse7429DRAFT_2016 [Pseudanabaena biceps PCC 7429]MDG3494951.1 hypothetical protein [Pseudanabaena catenata USMAC16]